MRRVFLALVAVCLATTAASQDVQVRSGRHDDFTRLIVDLPRRMDIEVEQNTGEATIRFPGQKITFDTSRVFRRIAQERVRDVTSGADGSTLQISFGCRCEISSFWHGRSLLVLDVRESRAEVVALAQADVADPEESETLQRPRLTLPENMNSFAASLANTGFQIVEPDDRSLETPSNEPDLDEDPATQKAITDARQQLIKQIGRATAQGLLEPRSSLKQESTPVDAGTSDVREHKEEIVPRDLQSNVNLHAQSSIDRDFLASIDGRSSLFGSACSQANEVDVGAWGTDETFARQIGSLRLALMGEFDELNKDSAIQLIRLYLYFGFGEEAASTLRLMEEESESVSVLRTLTEIITQGYATTASGLSGQLTCEGPSALWAVLSYPSLPSDVPIETDAALRAFDALPEHLRRYLGPILARRFLDAGHYKTADKVTRILNRNDLTHTAGARLAEAEVDLAEGQDNDAAMVMKEVVEANEEPSAEALIQLIDTTIQSGQTLSYDYALLAGAYVVQYRDGPLEGGLIRAYLSGLAASGAFEQAYQEKARLSSRLPPDLLTGVDTEMLSLLTGHADDISFLKHVLTDHSETSEMIAPRVANATSARLLELGFASEALQFIENDPPGDTGHERRLLRARISLAEGHPRQTEAELASVEGETSDILRAQARAMIGDHSSAAALYASAGAQEQSLRQAWFAEDWRYLVDAADSVTANFAALASLEGDGSNSRAAVETGFKSDRVLAQNRELIQKSLAVRETIEAVLAKSPSP